MTTITAEITEAAAEHAAVVDALHATFGDDAHTLVAKVEHRYRTTLAPWRSCVDRVVAEHLRTRYRYHRG